MPAAPGRDVFASPARLAFRACSRMVIIAAWLDVVLAALVHGDNIAAYRFKCQLFGHISTAGQG